MIMKKIVLSETVVLLFFLGCSSVADAPPGDATNDSIIDDHGNGISSATPVKFATTVAGVVMGIPVAGNIEVSGDKDYFSIWVNGAGTLRATTTGSTNTVGTIYDSDGRELATDNDGGIDMNFNVSYSITSFGAYYLRVTGAGTDTGMYGLAVIFISDHHSNDIAQATPVTVGTPIAGNIGTIDDQDYFSIVVTSMELADIDLVVLTATTTGDTNTMGAIYDSTGAKLAANDDNTENNGGEGGNFDVSASIVSAGTYYVRVTGTGTDTGMYSLTVTSMAVKHGNDRDSATPVTSGTPVAGNINPDTDEDYFSIVIPGAGTLRATSTGDTDTIGTIYDSTGAQLAANDDDGEGMNFDVSAQITSAGTYYVRVSSFQNNTGIYGLTVTFMPDDRQEEDIPYVQTVKVPDGASLDEIVELSARVVPHPRQMDWHKDEFLGFIHWGPNTFSRRERGTGNESLDLFQPSDMDTDQWCRVMKNAGMKRVVVVAKHHDGFCLWPSRYTKHSVASSSWLEGKGDVLRSLSTSCKKYGLKLGIYLSPADLYEIKDGNRYANQSAYRMETIPTPVAGRPFKDKRTFQYEVDDYNLYFMNQLFELLTEYGLIYEVWFDGYDPVDRRGQTYARYIWAEMIHALAPNAVVAIVGRDVRWIGNESGETRNTEYNVLALRGEALNKSSWNREPYRERFRLKDANWLHYIPAEVNFSIRSGWFYRDDTKQKVRNADRVFDLYERSVGGNTSLLLNIPPNREGTFSARDVASLTQPEETGRRIRVVYGSAVSEGAAGPREVLDGDERTFWQPDGLTGAFEIKLPQPGKVNRCVLQEALASHGQRVEKHKLDAWVNGKWKQVASATSIGYKRILRFTDVTSDRFRVRITNAFARPTLSRVSLHYYDAP